MSKSKGEFLILDLLKEKGYDPLAYRFFCLQSHYRRPLVFSYEGLDNAATAYRKLRTRTAALAGATGEVDTAAFEAAGKPFAEALANDINTSLAITAVYDVLKADMSDATKRALIADFDRVLALDLLTPFAEEKKDEEEGDPEILEQIALRAAAKKAKNYAEADRIRNELAARGITLIDTPQGTTYKKA